MPAGAARIERLAHPKDSPDHAGIESIRRPVCVFRKVNFEVCGEAQRVAIFIAASAAIRKAASPGLTSMAPCSTFSTIRN
jgi:hypothetical protein